MLKTFLIVSMLFLSSSLVYSQFELDIEHNLTGTRKYVIGIGSVIYDSVIIAGKKALKQKYVTVGSGLVTYAKYDSTVLINIVTARHVIDFFLKNNLKSIFLRPSWADTIQTIDYFGVEVALFNKDKSPNFFLYPDNNVDLGSILMPESYYNNLFVKMIGQNGITVFPYNSMTQPALGEQVWIGGYPGHIQTDMQNRFLYNISTFKPGYIAWKPSLNMNNSDLSHITLVESNSTYGNSGGPVFSFKKHLELVGILVGGYEDINAVYINNKAVIDSTTKQAMVAKTRSGVSIIEKAEYVKKLIEHVQLQIISHKESYK